MFPLFTFIRCQLVFDWFSALRNSEIQVKTWVFTLKGQENLNFKFAFKFMTYVKFVFVRLSDLWKLHPKVLWYRKYLFSFQDSEHYIQLRKLHAVEIWLLKVAILPPLATPIHTPKMLSVFGGLETGLVTKYLWHLKLLVWKPVIIVIVIMLKFMKIGVTKFLLFRIEPNLF